MVPLEGAVGGGLRGGIGDSGRHFISVRRRGAVARRCVGTASCRIGRLRGDNICGNTYSLYISDKILVFDVLAMPNL